MQITFKTVVDQNGVTLVEYSKDGKVVSRQETDKPLEFVALMLQRMAEQPHIVTDLNVTITGIEVPGMN